MLKNGILSRLSWSTCLFFFLVECATCSLRKSLLFFPFLSHRAPRKKVVHVPEKSVVVRAIVRTKKILAKTLTEETRKWKWQIRVTLSKRSRGEKKNCICASHTLRRKVAAGFYGMHTFLSITLLVVDNPSLFIQSSADVCVYLTACMSAELQKKKWKKLFCVWSTGKSRSHITQQNSLPSSSKDSSSTKSFSSSSSSVSCSFFTWDSAATSVAWPRISNNLKWSHCYRRGTPSCSRPRMTASANSSRPGTPCWRSWNCWNSGPRN